MEKANDIIADMVTRTIGVEAKFKEGEKGGNLSDYIDVPVSKASYRVDFLKKTKNYSII